MPQAAHTRTRISPLPQAPRSLKRNTSHAHAPSLSIPEIRIIAPSNSFLPSKSHPDRQHGATQLRDRDHRPSDVLRPRLGRVGNLGHSEPRQPLREAGKRDRRGGGIVTAFAAARQSWEVNMAWQSKILAGRGGRTVSGRLRCEDEWAGWF